jgi:hypothetical protein
MNEDGVVFGVRRSRLTSPRNQLFFAGLLGCYLRGRKMAAQTKGVADAAASLKSDFLDAATRRRDEATKSPFDERYHEAMQLLAVLAATVDQIQPGLLEAYAELWEGPVESEAHAELLREVGFSFWPSTAAEFVSRFISKLTG